MNDMPLSSPPEHSGGWRLGWPSGSADMLLRALALPEEQARGIWHEWESSHDIDDASWTEFRLLAALAPRIKDIAPDTRFRHRLEGIRRFVWTKNQLRLDQSLDLFDVLAEQGITPMLLKGGARLAVDPANAGGRFLRDLDIYLKPDEMMRGIEALLSAGFRPITGKFPGKVRAAPFDRVYGGGVAGIEGSEVDIHRAILRFGRRSEFDLALWHRARTVSLRGRAVCVPHASDQFVLSIAHGMIADIEKPADWAVDALYALQDPGFDWDLVGAEIDRRRLHVPMKIGLDYLHERLGCDVPERIAQLDRNGPWPALYRAEFAAETRLPQQRSLFDRLASILAEHLRSRTALRPLRTQDRDFVDRRPWRPRLEMTADLVPLGMEGQTIQKLSEQPRLQLWLDNAPRRKRLSFDVLVNGIWRERLKVRMNTVDRRFRRNQWVFPLAGAIGPGDKLAIIALDDVYIPQDKLEGWSGGWRVI